MTSTRTPSRPGQLRQRAGSRTPGVHPWVMKPFEPGRACVEGMALVPSWPLLLGGRAREAHPVLVIPGLGGGNVWTVPLRTTLTSLRYQVHGIRPKSQRGLPGRVVEAFAERIEELATEHGQPISIVAWSVGGAYARQAALMRAPRVRQLITLGSPLDGPWYTRRASGAQGLLPFPTTAVHSRSDGVYDWRRCLQPEGPQAENVEIFSSHVGMSSNPLVLRVITNRLALPAGSWHPYGAGLSA
ncbi:MAG TPA: alpha/beta hydrolase [Dermatophilaceae bacterium]|nr:alpha/beta hydrolase [Dermatophilaceae bacterium]